ncbi:MAG: hypothetical protein A3G92_01240 [Deltaproteobacteria bacterium RIFCSPLOWO2_12_FULL_38_8]|nr:MAG: hypothetical protein A3G92_01240 [Deltaproteobacteria bacterium RIFCSPLOWO2_12_FULL_38_8]
MKRIVSFFILICLFFLSHFGFTFDFINNCPSMSTEQKQTASEVWNSLVQEAKRRSIENKMVTFLNAFNKYCGNPVLYGMAVSKSLPLLREGQESHIQLMKKEIERVSKYRAPLLECAELKEAAQTLNRSINCEDSALKRQMSQGIQAASNRIQSCTNVDNRTDILQRPRDQDSTGWCYAYTVADLLSYKTGKLISAAHVANTYNDSFINHTKQFFNTSEADLHGGMIKSAAEKALQKGVCLEEDLPSSDYLYSSLTNIKSGIHGVENAKDLYDESLSPSWAELLFHPITSITSWATHDETIASSPQEIFQNCPEIQGNWKELFPNLNMDTILEVLAQSTSMSVVDNLIARACLKNSFVPDTKLNIVEKIYRGGLGEPTPDEMTQDIDDQLNHKNIVGIYYKASLLQDRYAAPKYGHASSVVARRFNFLSGACEYLIRNSWGSSCANYDSEFSCSDGHVWIPQEHLVNMMYGITYVQ